MSDDLKRVIKERLPVTRYLGPVNSYILCHTEGCARDERRTRQVYEDGTFCHKCRQKDDIFDYFMREYDLDFNQAFRKAAAEAGVPIEANKDRSALLFKLMAEFQKQLFVYQPEKLQDLIEWRGWTQDTIGELGIGYCDPKGQAIKRSGIPIQTLIDLSILSPPRPGEKPFFRFADRYVYPIKDVRGDMVSMKGRLARGYTPEEEDRKKKVIPLLKDGPWGPHSHMEHLFLEDRLKVARDKGFLIWTEGEPNAVSIFQNEFPVVGLQTNKGLVKFAYKVRDIKRHYSVLDNDYQTLKTLYKELYDFQMALPEVEVRLVILPHLNGEGVKMDVDEFFHVHGKTRRDFFELCKNAPDFAHVIIRELGKSPRNYALLYALINRMKHRKDELLEVFSEVSGRDTQMLSFCVDTAVREERGFPTMEDA